MEIFILDTNIFFNMEAGLSLGATTKEVILNLTKTIKSLKERKKAEFFMTPKIIDEFLSFFKNKEEDFIKNFLSVINIESPNVSQTSFSGMIFYKLIDEVRERAYRGLNIAEEEIEKAAKDFIGFSSKSKKDFQIKIGDFIRRFRERYRKATRFGFLDSVSDFELIVLAKQKDGYLVSTDEGVLRWGRVFGVKEMPSLVFAKRLEFLLQSHQE